MAAARAIGQEGYFFKTCKARFSLRKESFTRHDFRRTSKAREDKTNEQKQKRTRGVQRRAPHHHHYIRDNLI
jgi:hypothetical protein